jgi:trans-aconitate 2-methyltransferase
MSWNPELYLGSEGYHHRLRPALDLIDRIPLEHPGRVVDLGCGAGDVTALVARRWPNARITGIDNAPAMLERAKRDFPQLDWQLGDIAGWEPDAGCDLIICNASLQWVGDHERLLPRLLGFLTPGGVLAVQMPRNYDQPSHLAIRDTVRAHAWRSELDRYLRIEPVGTATFYYRLLCASATRLDVWETEYLQVLTGVDPITEWTKATTLRPFLDALEGLDRDRFEAEYRDLVRCAYPPEADGKTLFPFRRLFLIAER